METKFTKLSSKGQIIIPQEIRERLNLVEGTPFMVVENNNAIIIKKVNIPKIKNWAEVSLPFREAAKKAGFTREDLNRIIEEKRRTQK